MTKQEILDRIQNVLNQGGNLQIFHQALDLLRHDLENDIIEEENKFSVYIKKNKDVLPWKDFNKNMAVSVEYNLEY